MDLFGIMAKQPTFTIGDVNKYYNNMGSARSAVKRLISQNKAMKIRNDLYTCVNPMTGGPVANRFQIASAVTDTSYVSHHTAMEYYGITNQVYYDVYVSSESIFNDFEFDGYSYHFIRSRLDQGIETPAFNNAVRVTDKERTTIDCIKDMDKISGLEELLSDLKNIRSLSEEKMLKYLELYNNQFLYQKTGFLLHGEKELLGLSESFFDECKQHIGKSKRYLTADIYEPAYNDEWKLVIPRNLSIISDQEVITDAAI